MFDDERVRQIVGRVAWVMAWVGLVGGQLHALARHNTADGAGDLALPLTRWWSDPARQVLRPLLDWADPDTVYLAYGKIWLPVGLAFTACAILVYRRRRPTGFERWAWRAQIAGCVLMCLATFGDYYVQWTSYNAAGQLAFFVLTIPGLALMLLASTVLGATLLVKGFRPVVPAVLLAAEIPLAAGVLTMTSMGNALLPVMFAFGILGLRMAREPVGATAPRPAVAPARI